MSRAMWKGTLSFGLVNIPVAIHSAVQEGNRISFRMLHKGCGAPVRYDRVCTKHGEALPWDQMSKGFEYEKDKFVIMDENDFAAASVEGSKAVEIAEFVSVDQIDPRYFEKPYFLLPQRGGERGYNLIREALAKTGKVGLGKVTLKKDSQHLAGVRAVGGALTLDVMRFSDALVDEGDFEFPQGEVSPQELAMAEQLIGMMSSEKFDPDKYENEYHARLRDIIQQRIDGKVVQAVEAQEPAATPMSDLMAKLKASLTGQSKAGVKTA